LDAATLEKLMRIGGKEFVARMVDLFLGYTPGLLAKARAALQAGDSVALRAAVHPLKSSAGNVGACAVRDLAARLEQCALDQDRDAIVPLLSELETVYAHAAACLRDYRTSLGDVGKESAP